MNEVMVVMKVIDIGYLVVICNGDLLFMELIVEECKDVDIFGINMYCGVFFGDVFEWVW